jgi:glycosyltransferase involved in cell wall biosynthesis
MKTKIKVVFSSHLSDEENESFKKHVIESCGIGKDCEVYCYKNFNEFSLSEVYNRALDEIDNTDSVFIFCHNDIEFNTEKWGKRLLHKFNNFDYQIIGVAGTTYMPETGRWWDDRSKMVGVVYHEQVGKKWSSEYSETFLGIRPVITIDGLFMCVDPDEITTQFDESFSGFHFYDLGFCFPNYLDGVNVGVITDIRITHKSIGETNQQWEENRKQFVDMYKDYLPMKHINEDKLRVLICCQFFQNYTGSEVSNYELGRELVNQGCDVTLISTVVGDPLYSKAKKAGIKVFSLTNPPNYFPHQNGLVFVKNEADFDIIHINHKPIGENILRMYQNTPAVMHVRSEVIPQFEEPIINPMIKRYISIRESITEYIKTFGVSEDKIVEIDNPFDYRRFNCDYKQPKTEKESVLFVGTLDHLRKNILFDLKEITKNDDRELWIIGANNGGYVDQLTDQEHVKYFGVQDKPEEYIKKCTYTAGIFKGRTTIEGFLCGKGGLIYEVDKEGNILSKEFYAVPDDVDKYRSDNSAKKVIELYNEVIDETWLS